VLRSSIAHCDRHSRSCIALLLQVRRHQVPAETFKYHLVSVVDAARYALSGVRRSRSHRQAETLLASTRGRRQLVDPQATTMRRGCGTRGVMQHALALLWRPVFPYVVIVACQ